MATNVLIDVCKPVKNGKGADYREPMVREGKLVLTNGKEKRQDQITPEDEVVMETILVGRVICLGLDAADEKATGADLRKRFALSGRVEQAMQDKALLELKPEERQTIDATYELVKNGMFQTAVQECLANSQPAKKPAKAA